MSSMKRRIKTRDRILEGYVANPGGTFWNKEGTPGIDEKMMEYCGKIIEVEPIKGSRDKNWFEDSDARWSWSEDMFDDKEDVVFRILEQVDALK